MSDLEPGAVVDGRYRIVNRLGSGGMADVFCAEDAQLGRRVALKLLHRRFAADPAFVERFRREAQAAAGLQHPNVVSVYDRGEFDETYYIAMEYLPGRTLKALIREEAPLDPVRAIDIVTQVLKAARFAHRRGIVHRDLKPHNVMIDDAEYAKVTDFGIARAGASDMTETGSIMGTAQYLSPEQAQGHPVTPSSDLYSVGVVLCEMLTGRVPFEADSAVTIALKHVSEAPVPPSQINPAVPRELEQIVLWTLNKDPADRPADADQLLDALAHARATILAGAGQRTAEVPAVALAAIGDPPPRARARPADAAVGPAEAVAAYAAGAGAADAAAESAVPPDEVLPPAPGETRPRRADRLPWIALLLVLLLAGAGVAAYLLTRPETVAVPVVVGESVAVAQAQLQSAGFTPYLIYRTDSRAKDTVIGQSPLAGSRVDKGSTVTVTISNGPSPSSVPSIKNAPRAEAEAAIRRAGLKVGRVVREPSKTVAAGAAVGTDPGAGTSLAPGQPVTLFISSGPPPLTVPNVIGLSKTDAESRLAGLDITLQIAQRPSATDAKDTVIAQSATGTVPAGSTVTLTVATTPSVPSVTGLREADATAKLTGAGFKVRRSTKPVTDPRQAGVVISQSPAGGADAAHGSTVTIVVGKAAPTGTSTTPTTPTSTSTTPSSTTTSPTPTTATGPAPAASQSQAPGGTPLLP